MTPDPQTTSVPIESRVQLVPRTSATQDVDGGWWPRSTDLVRELPALLAAVSGRLEHVAVVGYPVAAWGSAPDHLDAEGGIIYLQGFISDDPRTVVVVGKNAVALSLVVVPPDEPAPAARSLLRSVSQSDEPDTATEDIPEQGTDAELDQVTYRLQSFVDPSRPINGAEISTWVYEAAAQFATAPIKAFVPILVEHIVRAQITSKTRPSA